MYRAPSRCCTCIQLQVVHSYSRYFQHAHFIPLVGVTMCVICFIFPFILDVWLVDVPAGVTQEEGHAGFLIHLPFAVLASIFLARRTQPFLYFTLSRSFTLSTVKSNFVYSLILLHLLGIFFFFFFCEEKSQFV